MKFEVEVATFVIMVVLNSPEFIPEETMSYDALLSIKNADVYPSASLSNEDYDALLIFASNNNWRVHNHYSQSSLLQAYSTAKSYPTQSFAKEEFVEHPPCNGW